MLFQEVHDQLYFCFLAKSNVNNLKHIDNEVHKILVYLHSFVKNFFQSKLSKELINSCKNLKISAKKDLYESRRVHRY